MTMQSPLPRHHGDSGGPPAKALGPGDWVYDTWLAQVNYFRKTRADLMRQPEMPGKFVAIRQDRVIDADADEEALMDRVQARYPREPVLVAKVQLEDPILEMPLFEVS